MKNALSRSDLSYSKSIKNFSIKLERPMSINGFNNFDVTVLV